MQHTETMQHTEAMPRALSLQALQRAGVKLDSNITRVGALGTLVARAKSLEKEDRQLVLSEVATHVCIRSLEDMGSLYEEFEHELWLSFMAMEDLEGQVASFISHVQRAAYAAAQYYAFLKGMFMKSGKTRHQFYYDMLTEAGIEMDFGSVDFGESAVMFYRQAIMSIHLEHLLAFYSVELFLKVYISLHPRDSPLSDAKVEAFYRHFEAAFPLTEKFGKYTKEGGLFKFSASHRLLPSIN